MGDEQHRVHWNERAAYLAVLRDLKEAVIREMDLVQVGAEGSKRLGRAIDEAHEARVRYRGQCLTIKVLDTSPMAELPDLGALARKRIQAEKKSPKPKPS